MQRYINAKVMGLLIAGLILGCNAQPRKADFQAQKPVVINILADSAKDTKSQETTKSIEMPVSLQYGFIIKYTGDGELHFIDEEDRHTGPATSGEYLPIVESLLKQPSLHEQERAGLENIAAKIKRTGSAAEFATTNQIPNLFYERNSDGTVSAEYKGAEEITLRLKLRGDTSSDISLKIWNDRQMKTAAYKISSDIAGNIEMAVSALMDDFTISWDSNGDGKDDRELAPLKIDSASVAFQQK